MVKLRLKTSKIISSLAVGSLMALGRINVAQAHCPAVKTGSITKSCESGVTVYRGNIGRPDFRAYIAKQNRLAADAKAQQARFEAQARQAQSVNRIIINNHSGSDLAGRGFSGFGVRGGYLGGSFISYNRFGHNIGRNRGSNRGPNRRGNGADNSTPSVVTQVATPRPASRLTSGAQARPHPRPGPRPRPAPMPHPKNKSYH